LHEYLLVGAKQFTYSILEGAIRHVPLRHMTPVFLGRAARMNGSDLRLPGDISHLFHW